MNCLITGSSGFIGSHLTKKIRETADTVYSMNRDFSPNLDGSGANEITKTTLVVLEYVKANSSLILFGTPFILLNISKSVSEIAVKFVTLKIKHSLIRRINTSLVSDLLGASWSHWKNFSKGRLRGSGTFEELAENIESFQDFIRAAEIKDRKSASTNPMLFYISTFANLAQGSSKRTALKNMRICLTAVTKNTLNFSNRKTYPCIVLF